MPEVSDALLVAGGLGTRMLPASAYLAKENLPLVDVPILVHLAREAIFAGVKRLHIITSPGKDLESITQNHMQLKHKAPHVREMLLFPTEEVEVFMHVQAEPKGLGDAIYQALDAVEGPFLVLLGDNLIMDHHHSPNTYHPSNASKLLVESYREKQKPCVGLIEVEQVQHYGITRLKDEMISEIVEKPDPSNAPSKWALCGRYLFPSHTKDLLDKYDHETHGELQSIALQQHFIENEGLVGVRLKNHQWYDAGQPMPWLKSQIDHALRREDLGDELRAWLLQRLQR
ncbi:MAG: hypothetical protein CMA84_06400 [Euryarchaeota archaeon]|nr:hypothetical protein [Euryarchaeota archaeon]